MKLLIILLLCISSASLLADDAKPNVVFLLSDDQGWADYGFMGHPHVKTPHLDQLASEGLLYERGYVTAPLCRPSLASLASGLYPHQTGIRGNDPVVLQGVKPTRNNPGDLEIWAKMRERMTAPFANQPSFIKQLQANGYATLQTGKWWEGDPLDHGFTDAMTPGESSTLSASCLLDSEANLALISVNANSGSGAATPADLGGYYVDDVELTAIKQPALPVRFVK